MKEYEVHPHQWVDADDVTDRFSALVEEFNGSVVEIAWHAWRRLSPAQKRAVENDMRSEQ